MLTELPATDEGAATRRLFRGDTLELVVWTDENGMRQFQLRYEHRGADGVFEWRRGRLYHYQLDDGEGRAARVDASPVLTPDGSGDLEWVRRRFREESDGLEPPLRTRIEQALAEPGGD